MAQVRPPSGAGVFYARSSSFFEKMQCIDNQRYALDSEALKYVMTIYTLDYTLYILLHRYYI